MKARKPAAKPLHSWILSPVFLWVLLAINLIRFIGIDQSPPGFYVDEAAGAAQVLCLKQTGSDFFHQSYPLFSQGLGGGYHTAPYLYGEMFWTSLFGETVASFRTFFAMITLLTVLFLYLWLRSRASDRVARFAVLIAGISPWVFQFARIAWDPPLAPFFLVLGLYLMDQKNRFAWVFSAFAFALASYSYPPSRIQVVLLLVFLPAIEWRKKFKSVLVFLVALIPMFVYTLRNPQFTARGSMLAIWSDYPLNPYAQSGFFGLIFGFITQFFAHFNPAYLVGTGDLNVRHSIQTFGLLSYIEAFLLFSGVLILFFKLRGGRILLTHPRAPLYLLLILGMASGIAPAALTWESVPHALRSIGAWPFFAALAALIAEIFYLAWKRSEQVIILSSVVFFGFFLHSYFVEYPELAAPWFLDEPSPLGSAYRKMTDLKLTCDQIRGGGLQ